jgi:hypothetical protein
MSSMFLIPTSFILLLVVITKYVEMVHIVKDVGVIIFSAIVLFELCEVWVYMTIDWISNILEFFNKEDDDDDLP